MICDLQKASMWKRISAALFDMILLGIAAVLFAWGISALVDYDGYNAKVNEAYRHYGEVYGVELEPSLEAYETMSGEERACLEEAYAALSADGEAVAAYNIVVNLTLLITSLGILLAYVVMEFIIPLRLGNGQTLGKKIFGIGLMRQDGVKVNGQLMFIRTFLGKYTLETMVPVLLVMMIWFGILGLTGTLVVGGIGLLQLLMVAFTSKHLAIHDAMAATVAVDVASQMIFPDRETMIDYKEKMHAEKVAREAY